MKYKTLFRVLLRVLGVYFVVTALANFCWPVIMHLSLGGGIRDWGFLVIMGVSLIPLALGLYLFFGGKWIVDKAIPGNRPYCPECGYDLTGATSDRCPECGTPFRPEDVQSSRIDQQNGHAE